MELHELITSTLLPMLGFIARAWLVRVKNRLETAIKQLDDVETKLSLITAQANSLNRELGRLTEANASLVHRMQVVEKSTGTYPAVPDLIDEDATPKPVDPPRPQLITRSPMYPFGKPNPSA